MNVLDLFSGIGGFSLGLERAGFNTVAFCECEPFCQAVLRKHWPDVPCFDDVRTLTKEKLIAHGVGAIDLICGGYPCQPFSHAGKRRGKEDDRHLWPEFMRLVREIRPTWVIGENVAGHISMGLDDVLFDLEAEGYQARTFVIPACAVGAEHRRDRVWTVAYTESQRCGEAGQYSQRPAERPSSGGGALAHAARQLLHRAGPKGHGRPELTDGRHVANAFGERQSRPGQPVVSVNSKTAGEWQATHVEHGGEQCIWPVEPSVGRVAHGIPARVDRLKSLGNAVVPQIPEIIGLAIKESCLM